MELKTEKCIGCRKGISLFIKKDGGLLHADLFASYESGSMYPCGNQSEVEPLLEENKGYGTFLANIELKDFYTKQSMWFDDIVKLSYELLKTEDAVSNFFYSGEPYLMDRTDKEIEEALIVLAKESNFEITEDDFPDLFIFSNNGTN